MDEAGGVRARAVHVDEVAGGSTEDAFSHVTAAGIPGAEDEDVWFHDEPNSVAADRAGSCKGGFCNLGPQDLSLRF